MCGRWERAIVPNTGDLVERGEGTMVSFVLGSHREVFTV